MNDKYIFTDRLPVDDYIRLRAEAGWKQIAPEQSKAGIESAFAKIAVTCEGETVGMARLLWDGGYCAYLTDVVVTEKHRHNGLAGEMVKRLAERLRAEMKEDWNIKLHLLAAPGREGFYGQFGFEARPNDHAGAGMDMWL